MRRHDLTKISTYPPTYLSTYLREHPQDEILENFFSTNLFTYLCTSIREHPKGAIIGICDIWDTDYNSDNWESKLMTIIVSWQLRMTILAMLIILLREQTGFGSQGSCHRSWSSWSQVCDGLLLVVIMVMVMVRHQECVVAALGLLAGAD